MHKNNVEIAEAYYTAMAEKNLEGLEKYLHPDVQLITPFALVNGKTAVLDAVERLLAFFNTLTIRAKCGSGDEVMLAYDLDFPEPIGKIRTAVLMTFHDGLIIKYELFFDTRLFEKK